MKKFYLIIIIFTTLSIVGISQTNKLDTLNALLKTNLSDSEKVDILYELILSSDTDSSVFSYSRQAIITAQNNDTLLVSTGLTLGNYFYKHNNPDSAIAYLKKCTQIASTNNYKSIAALYNLLGKFYMRSGDFQEGIMFFDSAVTFAQQYNDSTNLAKAYNGLGTLYTKIGNFDKALQNYQQSLVILEKLGDKSGLASIYNNIGLIQKKQKNFDKAIEYFTNALEISKEEKDSLQIAGCYINLATVYNTTKEYEKAKKNLLTALKILETQNNPYFMIHCLNILGDVYKVTDSLDKALEIYQEVISLNKRLRIKDVEASTHLDIAEINLKLADSLKQSSFYYKAIRIADTGLQTALKIDAYPLQKRAYDLLMKAYQGIGDYKMAFEYSQKYIETNEILFDNEKTKAIQEMEAKYELDKKQQEIEKQKLEIAKKEAVEKKQKTIRNALLSGSGLLIVILILIFAGYRRKKRDNEIITKQNAELYQANEEIKVQRDRLQEQKEKIEKIHQQLTDSINYAERIQLAAMPKKETLDEFFNDYFLIFRPLHIVSGDFYWAKKIGNAIIFTIADCTGHGVPGAFVSMLGISLLNEITQYKHVKSTKDVLEIMRQRIKTALGQAEDFEASKDGMDMVLCSYNTETGELEYSGANNPLILVNSDGEVVKYKPVRNPVGIYFKEKPFESIIINIQKGDTIYLFSDGVVDQFGSADNKKYTIKRLKNLLAEIHNKPLNEQKQIINKVIDDWKGLQRQTDDITIMGIKF